MSTIRLSGATSGHYDLTVPAIAGTNSIDLSILVVDNTATTLTGPLTIDGDYSVTGLKLRSGDTNVGSNSGSQIDFGFNGSDSYRHNITTRHDSNQIINNSIDFTVWQSSQNAADNGNRLVARMDGAGVLFPNQPGFTVYTTSATAPGNIIQFGGTSFNTGNHFNTSTGIFTAPITGHYWFYWHLLSDRTTTAGEGYVDIYKNSNYHYRNFEYKEAGGNYHVEYKGGMIMDLAGNDTMYLYFQTSANGGNIISNFHHCKFSGYLLG